jgi:hypothetical protein
MEECMTRDDAVSFAMSIIKRSKDWQEVQDAMANNAPVRAWLEGEAGGDDQAVISVAQSVIHEAEERLGDKLPADYS